MKFTIGNQAIDAKTFEPETYTPEGSKEKLRKVKIRFGIEGQDALERYNDLERLAAKYGVVSEGSEEGTKTLWKSSPYLASWKDSSEDLGPNWYEAIWVLREKEAQY